MKNYITGLAEKEHVKLLPEGLDAVYEASSGDLRKAINLLQAAASTPGEVDDIAVYSVLGKVSPQRVREMINHGIKGEFIEAREILRSLLIDEGLASEDIIRMVYSELMRMNMPEKWKVKISDAVGEVDFRLTQGARPEIQLSTLLAKLALASDQF
jgi:replication factor C small subunit